MWPNLNKIFNRKIIYIFSVSLVPSSAPSYVQLSNLQFTKVKVQWNPLSQQYANGRLLGYEVQVYCWESSYHSNYAKSVNTSSANVTMVILTDLRQASRCEIAVSAFTSKGKGPPSSQYSISTGNAFFFLWLMQTYVVLFKGNNNLGNSKAFLNY